MFRNEYLIVQDSVVDHTQVDYIQCGDVLRIFCGHTLCQDVIVLDNTLPDRAVLPGNTVTTQQSL